MSSKFLAGTIEVPIPVGIDHLNQVLKTHGECRLEKVKKLVETFDVSIGHNSHQTLLMRVKKNNVCWSIQFSDNHLGKKSREWFEEKAKKNKSNNAD